MSGFAQRHLRGAVVTAVETTVEIVVQLTLTVAVMVAVLCAGAALSGCGSAANQLSGSLGEIYPLDFDSVQAQSVGGYLVVQYVKSGTGAKPIKLTVDLTGYQVAPNAEISLIEQGAGGGPRGTIQRITDTAIDLPLATGTVTLDAVPTVGQHLGGHFRASFTEPAGRALFGDFSVDKLVTP